MRVVKRDVYVTKDGKEFLTEIEAKKHQKKLSQLRLYRVMYEPDLTEGRGLQKDMYVMVTPYHDIGHDLMVEDYLYRRFGSRAAYVQGNTRVENWRYIEINRNKLQHLDEVIEVTEKNIHEVKRRK